MNFKGNQTESELSVPEEKSTDDVQSEPKEENKSEESKPNTTEIADEQKSDADKKKGIYSKKIPMISKMQIRDIKKE